MNTHCTNGYTEAQPGAVTPGMAGASLLYSKHTFYGPSFLYSILGSYWKYWNYAELDASWGDHEVLVNEKGGGGSCMQGSGGHIGSNTLATCTVCPVLPTVLLFWPLAYHCELQVYKPSRGLRDP